MTGKLGAKPLTRDDVNAILHLHRTGSTAQAIVRATGRSRRTVFAIIARGDTVAAQPTRVASSTRASTSAAHEASRRRQREQSAALGLKAAPGTLEWYREMNARFVAILQREHPEMRTVANTRDFAPLESVTAESDRRDRAPVGMDRPRSQSSWCGE